MSIELGKVRLQQLQAWHEQTIVKPLQATPDPSRNFFRDDSLGLVMYQLCRELDAMPDESDEELQLKRGFSQIVAFVTGIWVENHFEENYDDINPIPWSFLTESHAVYGMWRDNGGNKERIGKTLDELRLPLGILFTKITSVLHPEGVAEEYALGVKLAIERWRSVSTN